MHYGMVDVDVIQIHALACHGLLQYIMDQLASLNTRIHDQSLFKHRVIDTVLLQSNNT